MTNVKQLLMLHSDPLKWPKNGFLFTFDDICLGLVKDRAYRDKATYAISISLTGKNFATFLDHVAFIHSTIPSCPRLRRVAGTSEIALFGQSWWMLLDPSWNDPLVEPARLDFHEYCSGSRLVYLGYNVIQENNLIRFVDDVMGSLEKREGLLRGHMKDGFVTLNFATFDFFYGFVFAAYRAGKKVEECMRLLPASGISKHYPETFDMGKVNLSDMRKLYDELDRLSAHDSPSSTSNTSPSAKPG